MCPAKTSETESNWKRQVNCRAIILSKLTLAFGHSVSYYVQPALDAAAGAVNASQIITIIEPYNRP